ncbi:MAG: glutamine-hydrolyzing carbamoyl-phosphate synthase small subunit [Kiritimatiellae bacterium]|nr:glutamine-hydrolyzing carbamoyl-phosphate synthase small subunit [Kiritimatiellia bacterium]
MDYTDKWQAERDRKAFLALDDGTVFHGIAFGARKDALGEVVFNTGMSGYQEILTDPSYAGQFVALTTAEVGNYGINPDDVESRGLFLSGLVIGDLATPSNWRSKKSLDDYLKENGIPGIYGVDTRSLTLHIREHGNRKAYLHVTTPSALNKSDAAGNDAATHGEAIARATEWIGLDGQDYAAKVTCDKAYEFGPRPTSNGPSIPHIVCYDFGVKTNILRSLAAWAKVTVVPAQTTSEDVLAMNPAGVFLSNGPADPAAVTYAIENIKRLLGKVPMMGICLGHQLLSLACGANTGRLKFGHHGCNHPVKNLITGKVEITSQNHNFAVAKETLPDCLEVTHVNLNDGTIEGIRHKFLPAYSVQYHPESCPGPHDSAYLFGEFKAMIGNRRQQTASIKQ